MWSKSTNHTPAQGQSVSSSNASQAAHLGAKRASAARVLGKAAGQAPMAPTAPGLAANPDANYKAHIAMAGAHAGVPLNTDDIHTTIGGLTQAGVFTPQQGQALIQHNGPLQGQAGVQTMHTITKAAINRKQRPPMPNGPPPGMAPPGAPPGPPGMAPPPRPPMPPQGAPMMGAQPPRPPGM